MQRRLYLVCSGMLSVLFSKHYLLVADGCVCQCGAATWPGTAGHPVKRSTYVILLTAQTAKMWQTTEEWQVFKIHTPPQLVTHHNTTFQTRPPIPTPHTSSMESPRPRFFHLHTPPSPSPHLPDPFQHDCVVCSVSPLWHYACSALSLRPWSTFALSLTIQSVAMRNPWSVKDTQFHLSAPLVSRSNLLDHQTESKSKSGPSDHHVKMAQVMSPRISLQHSAWQHRKEENSRPDTTIAILFFAFLIAAPLKRAQEWVCKNVHHGTEKGRIPQPNATTSILPLTLDGPLERANLALDSAV